MCPNLRSFGAAVAERLRLRGIDLPVVSVERQNVDDHRGLLSYIAEMMARPPTPRGALPELAREIALLAQRSNQKAAHGTMASQEGLPSKMMLGNGRSAEPGRTAVDEGQEQENSDHRMAYEDLLPQACTPPLSDREKIVAADIDIESPPSRTWRWADAAADLASLDNSVENEDIDVQEPITNVDKANFTMLAMPAVTESNTTLNGASAEASFPSPVIQVGTCRFNLPTPAVAAQRLGDIWKPGSIMTVVTTDHNGTPLFCPNGDIHQGLVNLTAMGSGPKRLIPLYWQKSEGLDAFRGYPSGTRGPAKDLAVMPTHLEGEEDEDDDG